jgi:CRISPR-associated protein Cmr4
MSQNKKLYTHQRFVFMTLDPVHIGTGGYRLGRVDNTIVREPGTNLPKIPGTSLMGAARSYSSMHYGKTEAAGQHKKLKKDRKINCPIIYTFGTATEAGGGQAGKISIGDAQILLFPVYSMAGPVWVSTIEMLQCAGFKLNELVVNDENTITSLSWAKESINLGWLMLEVNKGLIVDPPTEIKAKMEWNSIADRIFLVSRKLFSHIVNNNLEVRTSVAINPEKGTAEDKALFTYEALPRATFLWCDVIEDDYLNHFPITDKQFKNNEENAGDPLDKTWERPMDVVQTGLKLAEYLGVGGMSTRGFGRIKLIGDWEATNES